MRYSRAPQHSPDRAQIHTGQQDRAGETLVNTLTWTDGGNGEDTDSRERVMYEKWIKAETGSDVCGQRKREILEYLSEEGVKGGRDRGVSQLSVDGG